MQNYLDLMVQCRDKGIDVYNERTKKTCRTLVGATLEYDLSTRLFPATTSKRLAFKGVRGELLGFFRGYDSAADFRALGCNVWNDNANKTAAWLANRWRKGEDSLGRIYGKQWTDWQAYQIVDAHPDDVIATEVDGYVLTMRDPIRGKALYVKSINQLEKVLHTLLTNPSDRRCIVSGWNVGELDRMALPPCHMDYRFVAIKDTLHVVMTIRSWDLGLGAPFNIASTALFLEIMSRLSGFKAGKVTIQATNAHIYEDHFDAIEEQLSRPLFDPPSLLVSDRIRNVDLNSINGAFSRLEVDDFNLTNYKCHDAIYMPMSE